MTIEITRDIAARVLTTIDAGLVRGVGKPIPGQMCVEAAVCYAMGLPHGDEPDCVSPALRSLKIALNDKAWSSSAARAAGMRRLGLAQLGSFGVLDEEEFLARVVEMTIAKVVPRALRSAAKLNPEYAASLEGAAVLCETKPSETSARNAANAANAASYAAAAAAAAASYASYAVDADAYTADADAYTADAAVRGKARDAELAFFAEEVVKILVAMNAPGCRWLDMAPLEPTA